MDEIGKALGKIPSGIFILTACHEEQRTGMLASWVMQAAFVPPMLTVAIRRDRFITEWLKQGALATLNILCDDGKNMISHFGRGFEPQVDPFADLELLSVGHTAPILADAVAFLSGKIAGSLTTGDHELFALHIEHGRLLRDAAPMIHVRKDGMRY